jgi:hypothetical protein
VRAKAFHLLNWDLLTVTIRTYLHRIKWILFPGNFPESS